MTNNKNYIINFMKLRLFATALSLILILGSVSSFFIKGINWGLDFTGGVLVELIFHEPINLNDLRSNIEKIGFQDSVIQEFGAANDILIRIPGQNTNSAQQLTSKLTEQFNLKFEVKRTEFVGPKVGDQLKEQGGLGMLLAVILVMLYVAFRFQLKFSVGAVLALLHDSIIALGLFSILAIPFDLTVLAAILALIGYSLNDTIIIYDRVRENFRKIRKISSYEIINISLTQTLGRTLATSGTTLMVLIALFLFGGEMIQGFAIMLIAGVIIGTYSSIYIASNLLLYMNVKAEDLIIPIKENNENVNEVP